MEAHDPHFFETVLSSQEIFRGHMIRLFRDRVSLPDGRDASREVVRHPGAVGVVPLLDDGRVILVRQFRYPLGQVLLEIPAGKLDVAGEPEEACARRELLEETGYTADHWEHLTRYASSPGFSDEWVTLYQAHGLVLHGHPGDPGEFIRTQIVPLSEAVGLIRDGRITDAKTIIGLLWCQLFQDEG